MTRRSIVSLTRFRSDELERLVKPIFSPHDCSFPRFRFNLFIHCVHYISGRAQSSGVLSYLLLGTNGALNFGFLVFSWNVAPITKFQKFRVKELNEGGSLFQVPPAAPFSFVGFDVLRSRYPSLFILSGVYA